MARDRTDRRTGDTTSSIHYKQTPDDLVKRHELVPVYGNAFSGTGNNTTTGTRPSTYTHNTATQAPALPTTTLSNGAVVPTNVLMALPPGIDPTSVFKPPAQENVPGGALSTSPNVSVGRSRGEPSSAFRDRVGDTQATSTTTLTSYQGTRREDPVRSLVPGESPNLIGTNPNVIVGPDTNQGQPFVPRDSGQQRPPLPDGVDVPDTSYQDAINRADYSQWLTRMIGELTPTINQTKQEMIDRERSIQDTFYGPPAGERTVQGGAATAALIQGLFGLIGTGIADANAPEAPPDPDTLGASFPNLVVPDDFDDAGQPVFEGTDPRLLGLPTFTDLRDTTLAATVDQHLQDYQKYLAGQGQLARQHETLGAMERDRAAQIGQFDADRAGMDQLFQEGQAERDASEAAALAGIDQAGAVADANMADSLAAIDAERGASRDAETRALAQDHLARGQVDEGLGMQLDSIENTRGMVDEAVSNGMAGLDLATQVGRDLMQQGLDHAQALPEIIKAAGEESFDAIRMTMDDQFQETLEGLKTEWDSLLSTAQQAFDQGAAADRNRTAELLQTMSNGLASNVQNNLVALQSDPRFREMSGDQQSAALGQIKLSGAIQSGNLLADTGAKENQRLAANQLQRNAIMAEMKTAFGNAFTDGIVSLTASRWNTLNDHAKMAFTEYATTARQSSEITASLLDSQASRELTAAIQKQDLSRFGAAEQVRLTEAAVGAIGERNTLQTQIAHNMANTINLAAERGVALTESSIAVRQHNTVTHAALARDRADIEVAYSGLNNAAQTSYRDWVGRNTQNKSVYNTAMRTLQLQGSMDAFNMGQLLAEPTLSQGLAEMTSGLFALGTGILQQDFQNRLNAYAAEFGRAQFIISPTLAGVSAAGQTFANELTGPSNGGSGGTNVTSAVGGGVSGALGGAASGATIGSAVPGIGTGIGAAVGAIVGGAGGTLAGA